MTDHRELRELAVQLPLGTLAADDERRVEAHLRGGCAECETAVRGAAEVVDALVAAERPLEPSPALRARILAQAAAEPPAPPVRTRTAPGRLARAAWPLALAASVLVAVALGLEVRALREREAGVRHEIASLERRLAEAAEERDRLAAERDRLAGDRDRLAGELAAREDVLADLTARETRTVALAGTGPAPEASARAYLDPESRRLVLVVYELPPPPPGRAYQLWVIAGGEPLSAGVFELDSSGRARYETTAPPPLGGPVTIAVTLEPAGGVPKPTGPMVLAGT